MTPFRLLAALACASLMSCGGGDDAPELPPLAADGFAITGVVMRAATLRLLPGADIAVFSLDTDPDRTSPVATTQSGDGGRYQLAVPGPGYYFVEARIGSLGGWQIATLRSAGPRTVQADVRL